MGSYVGRCGDEVRRWGVRRVGSGEVWSGMGEIEE